MPMRMTFMALYNDENACDFLNLAVFGHGACWRDILLMEAAKAADIAEAIRLKGSQHASYRCMT